MMTRRLLSTTSHWLCMFSIPLLFRCQPNPHEVTASCTDDLTQMLASENAAARQHAYTDLQQNASAISPRILAQIVRSLKFERARRVPGPPVLSSDATVILVKEWARSRPLVLDGLSSRDPVVRRNCAFVIGETHDETAIPVLVDAFEREIISTRGDDPTAATLDSMVFSLRKLYPRHGVDHAVAILGSRTTGLAKARARRAIAILMPCAPVCADGRCDQQFGDWWTEHHRDPDATLFGPFDGHPGRRC